MSSYILYVLLNSYLLTTHSSRVDRHVHVCTAEVKGDDTMLLLL